LFFSPLLSEPRDWEVEKTFYPRTGDPAKTKGECRQTMIHDGRFLQSEFVFEQNGQKTSGLGLVGFDPESGQFTTVWTDSRSTRMSLRQSEEPFNGKEIVLHSRSIEKDARRSRMSRTSPAWRPMATESFIANTRSAPGPRALDHGALHDPKAQVHRTLRAKSSFGVHSGRQYGVPDILIAANIRPTCCNYR
jgi:hypothetical protein